NRRGGNPTVSSNLTPSATRNLAPSSIVASVAARLGYDVDAVAKWEIQQRYRQSWLSRLHRRARSALRRTFAIGAATVLAASQSGDVFAQF
ncbi:MAG TPA: hypothetical protein VLB05_16550, partial [Dongiaceae bacterium]|nr:hypothetical protein [Dongiaceae bacterium]